MGGLSCSAQSAVTGERKPLAYSERVAVIGPTRAATLPGGQPSG